MLRTTLPVVQVGKSKLLEVVSYLSKIMQLARVRARIFINEAIDSHYCFWSCLVI